MSETYLERLIRESTKDRPLSTYEATARAEERRQATQRRFVQLQMLFYNGGHLRCNKCQCEKHEATVADCANGWPRCCGRIMAWIRPIKAVSHE